VRLMRFERNVNDLDPMVRDSFSKQHLGDILYDNKSHLFHNSDSRASIAHE
jgi:hypothetical protein